MSNWTINTERRGENTRALCPIPGCKEYREHREAGMAIKFVTGHLVAQHAKQGVRASDSFTVS